SGQQPGCQNGGRANRVSGLGRTAHSRGPPRLHDGGDSPTEQGGAPRWWRGRSRTPAAEDRSQLPRVRDRVRRHPPPSGGWPGNARGRRERAGTRDAGSCSECRVTRWRDVFAVTEADDLVTLTLAAGRATAP